nr:hypothetical protein [Pandoravirus massiliensis]
MKRETTTRRARAPSEFSQKNIEEKQLCMCARVAGPFFCLSLPLSFAFSLSRAQGGGGAAMVADKRDRRPERYWTPKTRAKEKGTKRAEAPFVRHSFDIFFCPAHGRVLFPFEAAPPKGRVHFFSPTECSQKGEKHKGVNSMTAKKKEKSSPCPLCVWPLG